MAQIRGKALRHDGTAIDYVLIFEWRTGRRLAKIIPSSNGRWSFDYDLNLRCGITYVVDGCEPISHGPYDFMLSDI